MEASLSLSFLFSVTLLLKNSFLRVLFNFIVDDVYIVGQVVGVKDQDKDPFSSSCLSWGVAGNSRGETRHNNLTGSVPREGDQPPDVIPGSLICSMF